LTQDDCALFAGLAQEINRAIQSIETPGKKSHGVFVRLNTRSPKDAAIRNSERLYSFLVPEFERITNPEDRNATIVALRRGFGQAMRVTSGEEAMSLLRQYARPPKLMMDSASPLTRTRHDTLVGLAEDIRMAHEFIDRRWPLQVVIRQWNEVPLEYELRGTLDAHLSLSLSRAR